MSTVYGCRNESIEGGERRDGSWEAVFIVVLVRASSRGRRTGEMGG